MVVALSATDQTINSAISSAHGQCRDLLAWLVHHRIASVSMNSQEKSPALILGSFEDLTNAVAAANIPIDLDVDTVRLHRPNTHKSFAPTWPEQCRLSLSTAS
jgi:hypothetical protein